MIESILNGFEIWTDAQGVKSKGRVKSIDNISLEGIASLRQLIIELAIRGKLVGQDKNDEPAEVLLKEIRKNKENLINEGKAKKERNSAETEFDLPFEVPDSWVWVSLQTLSTINGGYAFKSRNYIEEGYRVIRISDFNEKGIKADNIVRYAYSDALEPFLLFERNILLAMTGGTVGKSYLVKELNEPMLVNQRVASINLIKPIHEEFIHYVIQSKHVKVVIDEAKNSTNDNISMSDIKGFKIPLPPLAEQIRITQKVNELLSWCDQLEEQNTNVLTTHHNLVTSLLETLTNAADADELQAGWEKLSKHFDTLFCTEDSIEQLKQTILQLAMMGRLVKQDENNEPASELVAKIKEVKNNLISEGILRKQKELKIIDEDEKPFVLPSGWIYERLNNVIDVRDGTHDSPKDAFGPNTYPLITSKDFKNGTIDFTDARRISASDHHEISKRSKVEKYDILFSMIGGNLGNQVMVLDDEEFSIKNVALLKYYSKSLTHPYFIKKYAELLAYELQSRAIGGAQPFVSLGFIRNLVIGLPPIEEQKQIVKKVDQLFTICDSLKENISSSENIKCLLSNTIVKAI